MTKIDSSDLGEAGEAFEGSDLLDGVLIPGGFGERGIDGIIRVAGWARKNGVPCFGVCLGMQTMVIEWCRNAMGWADANSFEFDRDAGRLVINLLDGMDDDKNLGGTMRLGLGEIVAEPGTRVFAAYGPPPEDGDGSVRLLERHRHRYEFSNKYRDEIAASGLRIAAVTPGGGLVECVEWPDHPWGVGVQFHPEFKSRPTAASPLFRDFIAAAGRFGARNAG